MLKTLLAACALLASLSACTTLSPTRALADGALATAQPPTCLTDTGTRLPPKGDQCGASGHSYTQGDIGRSGAVDTAQALRLDPSVTILYH